MESLVARRSSNWIQFPPEVATSNKSSMSLTEDDALGSLQRRLDHALSDGTERQCQGLLDWSMCARRGQMDGQVDRWVSPVQHKLTAVSSDTRL